MINSKQLISLLILFHNFFAPTLQAATENKATVILLHGLARTASSMEPLQHALEKDGFQTLNIGYPSTSLTPEQLFQFVDRRISNCCQQQTIHFVTHSMGGIIARDWIKHYLDGKSNAEVTPGRMVMLAPPNQGSEIIDTFSSQAWFSRFFGPAGMQLHTGKDSWPNSLPNAQVETGVIAADFGLNPLGAVILPGKDDGAVSLQRTHLNGEKDFVRIATGHTRIKKSDTAAKQMLCFIHSGEFCPE